MSASPAHEHVQQSPYERLLRNCAQLREDLLALPPEAPSEEVVRLFVRLNALQKACCGLEGEQLLPQERGWALWVSLYHLSKVEAVDEAKAARTLEDAFRPVATLRASLQETFEQWQGLACQESWPPEKLEEAIASEALVLESKKWGWASYLWRAAVPCLQLYRDAEEPWEEALRKDSRSLYWRQVQEMARAWQEASDGAQAHS